jgi:hypothetical protein
MRVIASATDLAEEGTVLRQRAFRRQLSSLLLVLVVLAGFVLVQLVIALHLAAEEPLIPMTIRTSAILMTVFFILAQIVTIRIVRWSRHRIKEQLFSGWLVIGIFAVLTVLIFRLPYSITFLSLATPVALLALLGFSLRLMSQNRRHIGAPKTLLEKRKLLFDRNNFVPLTDATLPDVPVDVIAVSNAELTNPKWTSFLAWCTLNAVPVAMLDDYVESQAGRVNLGSFKFNDLFARQSASTYSFFKRVFDIFVSVIVLLLLAVPMLVIGVIIRLETPGPAIFRQRRVGLGGGGSRSINFAQWLRMRKRPARNLPKKMTFASPTLAGLFANIGLMNGHNWSMYCAVI